MNFNTLSGSAKLYKKLEVGATGQPTPSGEVPNIAILCAVDRFANQKLVDCVTTGIKTKGGLVTSLDVPAFGVFNKINPMTAKYAASSTRIIAAAAEAIIKCGLYDGVVIIASCDITAAGLLQGAAYSNCPAMIVPVGTCMGKSNEPEIFRIGGMLAGAKINAKQHEAMIEKAKTFRGIPHEWNSVSTFFVLMEAMGFCVPNASLTRIESAAHFKNATATGEAIFESAKNVITPKKFLTRAALGNAIALCLAIGGDISAIATVTNLVTTYEKVPHELIAEYSVKTPLLLAPENQNSLHLHATGGIASILKQLSATPKFLDETALVYTGEKLKSHLSDIENPGLEPISRGGRIVHAKGSACELGGYSQPTGKTSISFTGKAWVYNSLEDADKALVAGNIPDNSVIVVHNCPNTCVTALAYTIEGSGKQIAIVTDGLCDKTSALVVTRCTPDSLQNQAFANIQNGDTIDINLGTGRLNTNISAKDIKNRAKKNSVKKPVVYFQ